MRRRPRPFSRRLILEVLEAREVLNFTPLTAVPVGDTPFQVAVGDFNGDGKLDLATANAAGNTVSVRLGDGMGGFSGTTEVSVGTQPRSLAVADFNRDGKLDLAVANSFSNTVSIRLGDGSGGFSGSTDISVGATPRSVVAADFNGDGKLDFATANLSNTVSVRLGDGAGGFSGSTNVSVGSAPNSLAVGDFNGDGKLDLATANVASGTVSVRLGDGTGGFSGSTEVSVGSGPVFVAVADFNRDGKPDLATANNGDNTVSIRLGDGSGGFSGSTSASVGSGPVFVAVADFDGDGKPDLATANNSNTVSVLLGDGAGGLSGSTEVSVGATPNSVAAGDFNGDGKPDLLVANSVSSTVSVLRNDYTWTPPSSYSSGSVTVGTTPYATAIGDFNRDGIPDLATANYSDGTVSIRLGVGDGTFSGTTDVSVDSFPYAITVGDFNRDGKLDFATANSYVGGTVSIRLGDGSGGFTGSSNYGIGNTATGIAAGDFNNDGIPDIVASNGGSANVSVLLGVGDGTFGAATSVSVGSQPNSVAVGDFNRDGNLDFAVPLNGGNVAIRLGVGDGTFTNAANVTAGSQAASVGVGDFNGDGILDLAIANYGPDTVSIRLGVGDGTFTGTSDVSVGTDPISIAVGDFNRDGILDFATANYNFSGGSLSLRMGVGDGTFTGTTNLSSGPGPVHIAVADLNRDGVLDIVSPNSTTTSLSVLLGVTTTTVNVSGASAYYSASGQSVTLTATAVGQTTGSISFVVKQGSTFFGAATPGSVDSNGVATVSYDLPAGTPAGSYTIEATYLGSPAGLGTGSLTISNATTSTSLATNGPTTYGDDMVLTATVAVTTGGFDLAGQTVNFYEGATLLGSGTVALVGSAYKASYTVTGGLPAGAHTQVNASLVAATNLDASSSGNVSHTVNTKTLFVTADNQTKVYGAAMPGLSYTVSGLANGEIAFAVLIGNVTTAATASSNAGNYPITQGTLTLISLNYTLSFTPGTLSITKAPLTITADSFTRYFGNPNPTLTGTITGLVNGDNSSAVTGLAYSTPATISSLPATYAITASGTAANYTITFVPGTLQVLVRPVVAVGASAGSLPLVSYYDADGVQHTFQAYINKYTAGVYVATGDLNGDGVADIVTSSGNVEPEIKAFSGKDLRLLAHFHAGASAFVACADVLRLGAPQIIVGSRYGAGSLVQLIDLRSGTPRLARAIRAFGPGYSWGVTVAGDDGVLVAGTILGNAVRVFSGANLQTVRDLAPWETGYTGGVTVAASGGRLAVGKRIGAGDVNVYDLTSLTYETTVHTQSTTPATSVPAGQRGGVRVAWTQQADASWTLVTGSGPGWPAQTQLYAAASWTLIDHHTEMGGTLNGLWVG
jgi:hypothetical protein